MRITVQDENGFDMTHTTSDTEVCKDFQQAKTLSCRMECDNDCSGRRGECDGGARAESSVKRVSSSCPLPPRRSDADADHGVRGGMVLPADELPSETSQNAFIKHAQPRTVTARTMGGISEFGETPKGHKADPMERDRMDTAEQMSDCLMQLKAVLSLPNAAPLHALGPAHRVAP